MQTLVVVKVKGMVANGLLSEIRKELIEEMKEGLIVVDDSIEISTLSISAPFAGVVFNIDEEGENEKSNVT